MFRKKHSQINIQFQNTGYSPFRKNNNASPLTRTPERSNLSPMKAQHKNKGYSAKSPRKQFTNEPYSANKLPSTREVNFQAQLQFLGNTMLSQYQPIPRQNLGSRVPSGFEESAFSNISNYQASGRHMKESKKIFSNVLSKMNSDKKKAEATPSQCSIIEQSKAYPLDNTHASPCEALPIASFKALRQIKMIQSIHPLPPPPQLQKSSSKKSNYKEGDSIRNVNHQSNKKNQDEREFIELVDQFKVEGKREKIVELINQSFSVHSPPMEKAFDQINIREDELILGKQANIFQSMEVDESCEFKELNNLLSKLQDQKGVDSKGGEPEMQSVKVSMESAKVSLTMDPFM